MKTPKFTLKDLIVNHDTHAFYEAFGISKERGKEITRQFHDIFDKRAGQVGYGPDALFSELASAEIAKDAREVAFVTYMIGCHVAESMIIEQQMNVAGKFMSILKGKNEDDYIN